MTPAAAVSFEKEAELIAAEAALKARGPSVPGVYGCIVRVSGEIAKEGISKTRTNQQQGYKFRGIDDVHNALAPMLAKHGLVILPRCLSRDVVERRTANDKPLFYVTVEAEFDFVCAADGSTHTVRMYGEAMDSADKATNKAMSAAYKYAAFQTFCIPTEGEDADEVTYTVEPARAPTPQAPAAPAALEEREVQAAATGENRGTSPDTVGIYPQGVVLITQVDETTIPSGKLAGKPKWFVHFTDGNKASTISAQTASQAQQCHVDRIPVRVELKKTTWGYDLLKLFPEIQLKDLAGRKDHGAPVSEEEIPF